MIKKVKTDKEHFGLKDLVINKEVTLFLPDSDGEIEIGINIGTWAYSHYVSLEKLEKWVASIIKTNKPVTGVCAVCGASAKIKVVGKDIWYCDNCIN